MHRLTRRLSTLCAAVLLSAAAVLGSAGVAAAVTLPPVGLGTVSLDQSSYTAHENQGYLTISIVRTGNLLVPEQVGYGVKQQDGRNRIDFDAIPNTYITMLPGQAVHTFQVRIIDQGIDGTPVHALAYLYGGYPAPLGANTNSLVKILHDDPVQQRDPTNPLGAPAAPTTGNPLVGVKLYVDPSSPSARAVRRYAHRKPMWASLLRIIADTPGARRFWMWNVGSTVAGQIAHYLQTAQANQPGSTVMLSSYNLVHGACGSTATPATQSRYDKYMDQVAQGIGNFHVVYFLELDSLITAPCLTRSQLVIRLAELRYAVTALERDPHVLVYLDAGAADAVPAARTAQMLSQAGIGQAQGFFVNATHFDWTRTELQYGQKISRMLGGAHFIINTGENGMGPLTPRNRVRSGNEVLCNPPGRGLGPLSVSHRVAQPTGYPGVDGFLWFTNPGGSGGQCVPGAPPTGQFWPAYAVMLARNWVNQVTGPSQARTSAQPKRFRHGRAKRRH